MSRIQRQPIYVAETPVVPENKASFHGNSAVVIVLAFAATVIALGTAYVVYDKFEDVSKFIPFSKTLEKNGSIGIVGGALILFVIGMVLARTSIITVVTSFVSVTAFGLFLYLSAYQKGKKFIGMERNVTDMALLAVAATASFAAISTSPSLLARMLMAPFTIFNILVAVQVLRETDSKLPGF